MPTSRSDLTQYQYLYERPSAQAFGIGQCQVGGVEYSSDGTRWIGGVTILAQGSLGWIVPALVTGSAATYTQSGTTITVSSTGHLMTAALCNGRMVYLGLTGGTQSAGWFTNFTYVDANTFTCTSSVSATDSGNVATNNTAANVITPISATIPANSMGVNGRVRITALSTNNNSAGTKTLRILFGGQAICQIAPSTNVSLPVLKNVTNRGGVTNSQVVESIASAGPGASNALTYLSIDTTQDVALTFSLQLNTASDWASLEMYTVELITA